jgi:TolA-binding protein
MKYPLHPRASWILAVASAVSILSMSVNPPRAFAQAAPGEAPITAPDAREYKAAEDLFTQGQFKEAADRFEKFLEKYKMLSPRSLDAKFRLAIAYVQQALYDDASRHLKELIANPKVEVAAKEMAQLLIAKSLTLKAFKMPADSEPQKVAQRKIFGDAIKEYDAFMAAYPRSADLDSAHFLRATLFLQSDEYDEAVKGFSTVTRIVNSPFRFEAVMWVGKTFFIQANSLLEVKGGKEPTPEAIAQALALFEKAQPSLEYTYKTSGDVAMQNDAVFFAGQMLLTRSQHVTAPDEEQQKQRQAAFLNGSLEAFRAVRSVEEVLQAQDEKIKRYQGQIQLLRPGTAEYLPYKNRLENLIDHEEEKKDKFKSGQDQYLAARLAIARIFLFLKKTDEARVLIRHLLGQKELFDKDKESQASIAALLCLTYAEQKKADKAFETYQEFRKDFKGNAVGDNLPLLVANALVEQGKAVEAEQVVAEGQADYKDWRFASDSVQVLTAAALKRGDYTKALDLCNKLLAGTLKPEVEAQTLFIKGSVQQAKALEGTDAALAGEALQTYKVMRDKFPNAPQAEDAWFNSCQILVGTDTPQAVKELESFLGKFEGGGGKSENTKTNMPTAQYLLGSALAIANQPDKAVAAWRKVIEKYPDSDPAPGAYFKIFDVDTEKKDYPAALKVMEDFLQKYPKHENVYYAYNNIAEFLFSGTLEPKATPDGKPLSRSAAAATSIDAGTMKLYDYVDYELSNNLERKRGDSSLMKIADRWVKELSKLPPYLTQNADQRAMWQKAVDSSVAAVERLLKDYPKSERVAEGLERLVAVQSARRKAQQADAAQIETYFKDLVGKFGSDPLVKAKIQVALASFLHESDPKRAFAVMEDSFRAVPEPVKKQDVEGGPERVVATFTPADFDRYLAGLFEARRTDDVTKVVGRIRQEYPLEDKDDPASVSASIRDGQSVALFWEAKLLLDQGKVTDAGAKFSTLKEKFPKSAKALEADYGVILGEFEESGKVKDDYLKRLQKIISTQTGKNFELQAKALFLSGRLLEARKDFDAAVETYRKVHGSYSSVPKLAAEGLWKAAQIAEKQATDDPAFPVRTAKERRAAAEARAADAKAAAAAAAASKPEEEKPSAEKPAPSKSDVSQPAKPDGTSAEKPAEKPADKPAAETSGAQK